MCHPHVTWKNYFLKLSYKVPITINYEHLACLTMLSYYKIIYITAESLSMTGCVPSDNNHNLTHSEKLLLHWGFKLEHTHLSKFQWVGRQCWLVNLGENMGRNNVNISKCSY